MEAKKEVVIIYYMFDKVKTYVASIERRNHKKQIVPRITYDFKEADQFYSEGEARQAISEFHDAHQISYKTEWVSLMVEIANVKHDDAIRIF